MTHSVLDAPIAAHYFRRMYRVRVPRAAELAHLISIVHPRTYQRWIGETCTGGKGKRMGRPKTLESIREIVIRIAKETGWGYDRILGELKKLRIHAISQSTIKNILKEAGMLPRPKRGVVSVNMRTFVLGRLRGNAVVKIEPPGKINPLYIYTYTYIKGVTAWERLFRQL